MAETTEYTLQRVNTIDPIAYIIFFFQIFRENIWNEDFFY